MKYLGKISLIGTLIFGIYQLAARDFDQVIGISLFIIVFGLLSLLIIYFEKFYRIQVDKTKLIQKTVLGKINSIKWENIKDISFNRLSLELKIKDKNSTIRIHAHTIGFNNLLRLIEKETQFRKKDFRL